MTWKIGVPTPRRITPALHCGGGVMIKPDMIPDEVFEAFQKAWADTSTLSTKECLAAALNAWPEMEMMEGEKLEFGGVFLPLPQENSEEGEGL